MENSCNKPGPAPRFLEFLFAVKSKASAVFRDVLGIHEIHHLSITLIRPNQKFLCLSSTPALEYNLFNSRLWLCDRSFSPDWYQHSGQDFWQDLYLPERYDELYYLKQIKPRYPTGLTQARTYEGHSLLYAFASKHSSQHVLNLFTQESEDLTKIGQYCFQLLEPLFDYEEELFSQRCEVDHATSD